MPTVTESWKNVTRRPRTAGGETSDILTGAVAEARPIAMPTTTREMTRIASESAAALPSAPTMKTTAEPMIRMRRP
jgi:hypothetical protein